MVGQIWNFRRSALLFLPSLALLTVCYYYYGNPSLINNKPHNRFLPVKTPTLKEIPKSGKIILYWTSFFESLDFYVGFGNKPFHQCKTSNCFTTNDRSLLNQSDAVIFHIRNTHLHDLPPTRLPHQKFIFFLQESPQHTPNILSSLPNFFNWTMTYRLDSDIHAPYTISDIALKQQKLKMEQNSPNTSSNEYWKRLLKKKKKIAAWFVSNCFTSSERERYVAELKKYIEIDVYGACGTLECVNRLECYDMLERDYKFYLSFENSLCRDYVTEKFYSALQFTTIPIVYGSGNYSTVAPKKSYIDVRDFSSAHELAKYLKFLMRNDSAYLRYFDWRNEPSGLLSLPRRFHTWCTLCEMLNNSSLPNHSYTNIHHWWFELGHCGQDHSLFQQIV